MIESKRVNECAVCGNQGDLSLIGGIYVCSEIGKHSAMEIAVARGRARGPGRIEHGNMSLSPWM